LWPIFDIVGAIGLNGVVLPKPGRRLPGLGNHRPETVNSPSVASPQQQSSEPVAIRETTAPQPSRRGLSGISYQRKKGDRVTSGLSERFRPVYNDNGKLVDLTLERSTGDTELDAAIERDKQEFLDKLRRQLESRSAEERDRPIRIKFEANDLSAAERRQAEQNAAISAQREAERQAARSAPSNSSRTAQELPLDQPPLFPLPESILPATPSEPASEPVPEPAIEPEPAAEPIAEPEPIYEPEPVYEPEPIYESQPVPLE
jgi:hypothetical protein